MKSTTTTTTTRTAAKTTKKNKPRELKLKGSASSNGSVLSCGSAASSNNMTGNKLSASGSVASSSTNGFRNQRQQQQQLEPLDPNDPVPVDEIIIESHSPPWKETFDMLADQAFNIAGFVYLSCMIGMAAYYIQKNSDVSFWDEFVTGFRLGFFHNHGVPFFGMLGFMVVLRKLINGYAYPLVLDRIYKGKNEKYTAHYCEWLFDAIKNCLLFGLGAYVAYDSDWIPRPTEGTWWWIPRQGGTIFDSNGEIVPTKDLALEVIGHLEVTVDFISLMTLCYDAVSEMLENKYTLYHNHNDDDKRHIATTTTSFAEDFVHHTGVVMGAMFLFIVAKDNCNAIAIIVFLGQFNDMCEFSALCLGLCKIWVLERVAAPILCFFWAVSLVYIWPAMLIPIFMESMPIEHTFDQGVVLSLTVYQIGSIFISLLFWAMHMFWLYKGLLFLYRYQRGVTFARKQKLKKDAADAAASKADAPVFERTACLVKGAFPATKEHEHEE